MLKAKKGRLLIAEPSLEDSTFFKSVILLTHHENNESMGLILNQATNIKINEIISNISSDNFPIYIGGPVGRDSIQYIHTLGEIIPNSIKIIDDVYWGGDFDLILDLISENKISENELRFFLGYSGWEAEQLNIEIKERSWIVTRNQKEYCMKNSNLDLWGEIIKTQAPKYAIWTNLPENPQLN